VISKKKHRQRLAEVQTELLQAAGLPPEVTPHEGDGFAAPGLQGLAQNDGGDRPSYPMGSNERREDVGEPVVGKGKEGLQVGQQKGHRSFPEEVEHGGRAPGPHPRRLPGAKGSAPRPGRFGRHERRKSGRSHRHFGVRGLRGRGRRFRHLLRGGERGHWGLGFEKK